MTRAIVRVLQAQASNERARLTRLWWSGVDVDAREVMAARAYEVVTENLMEASVRDWNDAIEQVGDQPDL